MVLTVLVSCTVGYAWFAREQFRRMAAERFALRSRGIAYAAVLQIAKGLQYDKNDYDSYSEEWFGQHATPIEGLGLMVTQIQPLDDLFPINQLFLPDGVTLRNEMKDIWERIWDDRQNGQLAPVVLDFMDTDTKPRLGSYERDSFINRGISEMSELLRIEGFPAELITGQPGMPGLEKIFTPWSSGKINMNVAPPEVLTLLEGVDESMALEIVEARSQNPFTDLEDLSRLSSFPDDVLPRIMNIVTFKSDYFSVVLNILSSDNKSGMTYRAILKKSGNSAPSIVKWEEM
jgi:type II secretory pathway component PulK